MGSEINRGRLYCLVSLFEIGCGFDPTTVRRALVCGTSFTCTRPGQLVFNI